MVRRSFQALELTKRTTCNSYQCSSSEIHPSTNTVTEYTVIATPAPYEIPTNKNLWGELLPQQLSNLGPCMFFDENKFSGVKIISRLVKIISRLVRITCFLMKIFSRLVKMNFRFVKIIYGFLSTVAFHRENII